jgi:hypothetical protein
MNKLILNLMMRAPTKAEEEAAKAGESIIEN